MDQITDPSNRLRDFGESNCRALRDTFRNYKDDYARGMMLVHISPAVNLKGATYESAVYSIHGKRWIKIGIVWLGLLGNSDVAGGNGKR